VILDGTVEVQRSEDNSRLPLGPGTVFGEIGLFLGQRSADVVVSSETVRLLALSDGTLRKIRKAQPELFQQLLWNICRILCTRLARLSLSERVE